MEDDIKDIEIIDKFCVGRGWKYYEDLKQKEVCFAYKLDEKEKEIIMDVGFPKLRHLLSFLKEKYGLDGFELIFFNTDKPEPFYIKEKNGKKIVYVNIEIYRSYGDELNPIIRDLRVIKCGNEIWSKFSKMVPIAFFNKEPPSVLTQRLKESYYTVIENLIREFEGMGDEQKKKIKETFEHSKLGTEVIEKWVKFNPDAPEVQLKKFIQVIEKLGESEVEELLNSILNSKISLYFIRTLSKLPITEQNRIIRKMPEMAKMYDRYEKLKKSLKEFEKKIIEHQNSKNKDEKDIHKFLNNNYWLLGIEYFDKEILSDITSEGKLTGDTKICNRKHADFIIKRIDGLDKCIVIELEEANDRIFNKDGSLSPEVYDGITQAVDYYIEQKSMGMNSKGIAVIGSTLGMER
jgi:hypothetical protein